MLIANQKKTTRGSGFVKIFVRTLESSDPRTLYTFMLYLISSRLCNLSMALKASFNMVR
jgi:hypothetical protein